MSEVIVVTSGKGGVGKTTVTANIGCGLAMMGHTVTLIDADTGLRNLDVVLGLENRIVYDLTDVIAGNCRLRQALIKDKRYEGLHLLPTAQTKDKSAVRPEDLISLCEELKDLFDYVIIDCPAGIEQGFKSAIGAAEKAIVVTTPEVAAIRDADRVIGLLEANDLNDPKVIVNRMRMKMVDRGDMMGIEDILDILGIELLGVIPDDEEIIIGTNRGEPIVGNDDSLSGKAFRNIVMRILGEPVPLLNLEPNQGLFLKLKKIIGFK
ncbi:MAG: septum site-determining protein MinD [Eubacteriales bacterium]|jgi:septum site-determining protein MinD|nr:septum site-determining protein MinD [Bacillota bacterium]MBV1727000.1 septum site-determining protein MinD [Desulforudis sp.]MDQ7789831.1 septum site-determining protein MinD [Clostridia bacterium]MDZ4043765.1 septum site-determining protein MinD [Eubacteriales bacterium]MBU4534044.1 septum site-determining protein MinD [Bacillota bacterium]